MNASNKKPRVATRRQLQRMAKRLAVVSDELLKLGADMEYYGGFGLMGDRGRELIGAGRMARYWTSHLTKMAEVK